MKKKQPSKPKRSTKKTAPSSKRKPQPSPATKEKNQPPLIHDKLIELANLTRQAIHKQRLIEYSKTGNPVSRLLIFIDRCVDGFYPLDDVTRPICAAFYKYLTTDGQQTIETLLGLTGGAGQDNAIKARARTTRDRCLCLEVFWLMRVFDLTAEVASHLVAAKGQKESTPFRPLKAKTIERRYSVDWQNTRAEMEALHKDEPKWSQEKKRKYIGRFPVDCLVGYPNLERMHPDFKQLR